MDLYVTPKTKVSLRLIDSFILIVFYSSLVDFYYIAPYLLNFVSSIKYVCQSNEISTKILNKKFMDISTMICDLIGFFNGFTRTLCQDYNCYLGCDAIYNERCFLHLRKNVSDSILVICRHHSGSNDYYQLKSMGQIIPKNRNIIQNNEKEIKIDVKSKRMIDFMKFKKNLKKKKYLGIDFNYEKNNNDDNEFFNENKNQDYENNFNMNNTINITNLDLPSESQILDDKEKDNEYDQVLEAFDFINNITARNSKDDNKYKSKILEEINKEKPFSIKINNLNKNNINYNKEKKPKKNDSYFIEDNSSKFSEFPDIQRNKTQNFNKLIANKNMELIKSIDFDELNNGYHNNNNEKENKISEYDNNIKDSLMYNFNQINNNYIDQENSLSYEKINRYNFNNNNKQGFHNRDNMPKRLYRNQSVHIPSNIFNKSMMNNINNSEINPNESINNIFYPIDQNISYAYENNIFNNSSNNSINFSNISNSINNSNNIYYPIQNINYNNNYNNINTNTNINNSINQSYNNSNNINYNTQSIVPFIPGFNNNQFQNNNNFSNPNQFSQNDLTFLGGYAKTNNLKEDFIKINPNNPEIISELKEKIYYYHSLSNGGKLMNIKSKGYIGINIRPPNAINNKEFYINFISEKWKDHNYFIERDINKNIQQVTEMIYKIQLQKKQKAIKLITYSISKDIISKIKIIDTQINLSNNQLIYKFNYYQNSHKFVQRIEVIVEYKNNYQFWSMIKTEGNITNNNSLKLNVLYNRSINEGTIIFPNNCNISPYIGKISIMVQLKNAIASNMNIKINYSNSTIQSQESLFCKKVSLLCFEYS